MIDRLADSDWPIQLILPNESMKAKRERTIQKSMILNNNMKYSNKITTQHKNHKKITQ